jgi:hybrid cluster-associated redox disulfide protein
LRWRNDATMRNPDAVVMQRKDATMPARSLGLQLTMAELIAGWPAAVPLLARRGMGCVGCTMARFETVAEAAAAYGFDPDALLTEIRRSIHSRQRRSS